MDGYLKRTPYGFEPHGENAWKIHKALELGGICKIEYVRKRNYENQCRYHVFIQTVFDMQEHFTDKKQMRKWIQMRAGHYEEVLAPNGRVIFFPKSIANANFDDELLFRKLFTRSITAVINARMDGGREFIPNMTENQLAQILAFD